MTTAADQHQQRRDAERLVRQAATTTGRLGAISLRTEADIQRAITNMVQAAAKTPDPFDGLTKRRPSQDMQDFVNGMEP